MEANSSFVEQREKEIQNVVRSIYELNAIFKVSIFCFVPVSCYQIVIAVVPTWYRKYPIWLLTKEQC